MTEALVTELHKLRRNYGHGLPSGVTIGPDNVTWLAGDCREFADIQTYIMRSVGLPGASGSMSLLKAHQSNILLKFCLKRLSQDLPCLASDRKFILPYVVRIKIIASIMKLLKLFRIFAFGLSAEATIELTWSSG